VTGLFSSLLHLFLSWWGAFLLAALDSTLLFVAPFGIDVLLVYLVARDPDRFWLFPLLTTAGSVTGAAITYWIGAKIGEKGLPRFISERRLKRLQARVDGAGTVAMAATAVMPPPFPMSAFVLTCGAFDVNAKRFFLVFAGARLIRFGIEAVLARQYGESILPVLRSDTVQAVIVGFVVLVIAGTTFAVVQMWRRTKAVRRRQ
jgi:membrane protein YqaA with SNARE-associated domain